MYKNLVSVIMPVFNAENYVGGAIESIINQTYRNWELIIVDDGSTDNSLQVVRKYERSNIIIYSQSNMGASAARNYGLREARGAYIQFLDADDLISRNKIEEQVKILDQNPGKVVYCPTIHFFDGEDYSNKKVVHDQFHIGKDMPVEFLINLYGGFTNSGGMIQPNAWLTPRLVINNAGQYHESLSVDDDGEYFCRVVLNSEGVIYSERAINYYRKFKQNNNLSGRRNRKAMESILKSTTLKKEYLLSRTDSFYAKKAIARLFCEIEVMTYPRFVDISSMAKNIAMELGEYDYTPEIGGAVTEFCKHIFGWKFIKILQHVKKMNRAFSVF